MGLSDDAMMHLPKSDMEECQRSLIASAYNMDRVMEKLQRLQESWIASPLQRVQSSPDFHVNRVNVVHGVCTPRVDNDHGNCGGRQPDGPESPIFGAPGGPDWKDLLSQSAVQGRIVAYLEQATALSLLFARPKSDACELFSQLDSLREDQEILQQWDHFPSIPSVLLQLDEVDASSRSKAADEVSLDTPDAQHRETRQFAWKPAQQLQAAGAPQPAVKYLPRSVPAVPAPGGPGGTGGRGGAGPQVAPKAETAESLTRMPAQLPSSITSSFDLEGRLGTGAVAQVLRLRQRKTGMKLALKVIEKHPLKIRGMLPQVEREVKIHGLMRHPNVLRLFHCVQDESHLYMILELAESSLRTLMMKQPLQRLKEPLAAALFKQIVDGVQHIHRKRCAHRDLKPENILLAGLCPKICDFGWCADQLLESEPRRRRTTCGSHQYMAPEVLFSEGHGKEVDLWSLGVLLYELLSGVTPFLAAGNGKSFQQKVHMVEYPCPPWFSHEACHLVRGLLQRLPQHRRPLTEVLRHPWLQKYFRAFLQQLQQHTARARAAGANKSLNKTWCRGLQSPVRRPCPARPAAPMGPGPCPLGPCSVAPGCAAPPAPLGGAQPLGVGHPRSPRQPEAPRMHAYPATPQGRPAGVPWNPRVPAPAPPGPPLRSHRSPRDPTPVSGRPWPPTATQNLLVGKRSVALRAARELEPKAWWIWKPINSSCGRGIKLLPNHLTNKVIARLESKQGIIQRYVERPLLLDGYKFDLRLYVVVTSFDPLKVYLFKEGLVRLATERYSLSPNSLKKRTMHLTNYSVNKRSAKYVQNRDGKAPPVPKVAAPEEDLATMELEEDADDCPTEAGLTDMNESEDEEEGEEASASGTSASDPQGQATSKWTLKDLQEYFEAKGLDYPLVLSKIKELIVKSLIAVETPIVSAWHNGANYARRNGASLVGPNQTCFELYGFDVLVDQKLRPWLLEVNTCPSLSSSSPLDKRLKTQLVADMLTLVGLSPYFEERPSSGRSRADKGARVHVRPTVERLQSENLRLRDLGEAEWSIILDAHDEYLRRGAYERIFPDLNFQEFFRIQRYGNCVLAKWLREGGETCFLPGREDLRPNWLPLQLFTGAC
ncbi:unnamed protein product [Cladocopium goreaui]|uniref:Tubulin--tyrosine ligase-like protein 5 n=1 Tax=Cladocopium goreaui TaxID=2562237 RepID=A0A9P1FLH4_9DINO|nr:unnamed protein product [Cladocopium goreaui]